SPGRGADPPRTSIAASSGTAGSIPQPAYRSVNGPLRRSTASVAAGTDMPPGSSRSARGQACSPAPGGSTDIVVAAREVDWLGAEGVAQPEPGEARRGACHATFLEPPRGGDDRRHQGPDASGAAEPEREAVVLEERHVGKTAQAFEEIAADERGLIAAMD